jgi:leucyl aminopeptidase (aminopeptidase T)
VRPGERAVLITDDACLSIGAALLQQLEAAQAEVAAFVLEEHVQRPTTVLPEPIARALEQADVSVFAACAQRGELPSRVAMTAIVNRRGIRHGHMVNITPRIMVEGMRADFRRVDALCRWVLERVRPAHSMTASSPSGTRLTATFSPAIRWIPTSGIIGREKWGNLPGGEVFTSPLRVDGVFVVDGVLGDWLANKYGRMEDNPLRIEIENSRIVSLSCARQDIVDDFRAYTSTDPNSNRVGELALGTNLALTDCIGQILQDEKLPGLHIAFGHPYAEHTGADWSSTTHVDVVGRHFDIDFDGVPLMRDSRFLVDADALVP